VISLKSASIDSRDELVCLGHEEDLPGQGGALAPPIVQTSLFAHESLDHLMESLGAEHSHHVYSRAQNPTREAVERKLATLERGEACRCFASGMGAVSATLIGLLEAGDHVLYVNNVYGPTLQLADRLERFGVTHDIVLDLDLATIEEALRPETRLLWFESPGTMQFRMLDMAGLVALARDRGVLTVMDNSWATPLFQKPITHGVDVVIHSASKYLGGHSDLVAGVLVTRRELMERIYYDSVLLLGAQLSPFGAWLLNRGLRTLPVRMRQHHTDGLAVARHLDEHPRVRRVHHPGLDPAAEPHAEACLTGFSSLMSFELDTDAFDGVRRFVNALKRFRVGVSWGGVESLVVTPNRGVNLDYVESQRMPTGLVRLSVGLEGVDLLTADLDQALAAL
jgi:cystathionine beta-lyase/cystathionine gamma-synthase